MTNEEEIGAYILQSRYSNLQYPAARGALGDDARVFRDGEASARHDRCVAVLRAMPTSSWHVDIRLVGRLRPYERPDNRESSRRQAHCSGSCVTVPSADWIHGLIDPAANGRNEADGRRLIQMYCNLGLKLWAIDNPIESGVLSMCQRMQSGRLKTPPAGSGRQELNTTRHAC